MTLPELRETFIRQVEAGTGDLLEGGLIYDAQGDGVRCRAEALMRRAEAYGHTRADVRRLARGFQPGSRVLAFVTEDGVLYAVVRRKD